MARKKKQQIINQLTSTKMATQQTNQTVIPPSPKDSVEEICGFCGRMVPPEDEEKFVATCDVCNRKCIIHGNKNCAMKLYESTEVFKTVPELDSKVFNGITSVLSLIHI